MLRATVAGSLLFIGLTASVPAQNLYTNGTFETAGGDGNPQAWQPWYSPSTGMSATFRQNPGDAPQGQNYVRVSNTSSVSSFAPQFRHGWGPKPELLLDPNCTYRVSYKYRRSAAQIVRSMGIATSCWNCYSFDAYYSPDMASQPSGPPTDVGVVGAWTDHTQLYRTIPFAGYNDSFWFGAAKSSVDPFATMAAGNYVDYDDIRLELVERHTSGTYLVSGTSSYSIANTSCTVTYTAFEASSQCQQSVELKTGTPPGLTVPALPWSVEISPLNPAPTSFSAQVSLSYTDAAVTAAGLTEGELKLRRREGSGPWEIIPATVNAAQNTVTMTGTTSQFSTWAITGPDASAVDGWEMFE